MEIKEIKLSEIRISDLNTRKDLEAGTEDSSLIDLVNSIKGKGLLSPITVRKSRDNTYDLIVGQRRFLACQKLGWASIPAIVRDFSDDTDATILSLIENVHRADMGSMDKARAYRAIYEKYKDYNKVASETGVSAPTIKKYLSLLNLTPSIQERLSTSDGPKGTEALSKLAELYKPEEQEGALARLSGFSQQIQLEMLKRSGGDLTKLKELKDQALEGAFDIHRCRSLDECVFIPQELLGLVKQVVKKFEDEGDTQTFKDWVKKIK